MIKVMYKSKKNNKKLAKAIGDQLQVTAIKIDQESDVRADILFLGCAILGDNVPVQITEFVERLDADKVKKVILFSANGFGTDQFAILKEQLKAKKILVGPVFSCKGSAFIFKNWGRPNKTDLQLARDFAKKVVQYEYK